MCDRIERGAVLPIKEQPDDGDFTGYTAMVADLWLDRDFTLRARAVGLSWLPFVAPPEHAETQEIARERLRRTYRLNDEEKQGLSRLSRKQGGRIAIVAAAVASRIDRYPVWRLGLFDEGRVRIDLAGEVTYAVDAAKALAEQERLLGPPPVGRMARDPVAAGLYIEKARVLEQRADALLARVEAFEEYRQIVAGIQEDANRQHWLDRVGSIDDLDAAAQAVADGMYADSLRLTAAESRAWATVYLPRTEPISAKLTAPTDGLT
ncbi:hypothetical protein GCM10010528_04450 [Gordonia defluvii]|uniref:Uncharacterized protein n=1 Tax=Gordonia defluvii TaxID=283718 RepID=A0ABN3YCM5_9ACTN